MISLPTIPEKERAMAGARARGRRVVVGLLALLVLLGGGGLPVSTHGTASAASTPVVVVAPSRSAGTVGPLITIAQSWNNCGPASVAEVLHFWGIQRTQDQVQVDL